MIYRDDMHVCGPPALMHLLCWQSGASHARPVHDDECCCCARSQGFNFASAGSSQHAPPLPVTALADGWWNVDHERIKARVGVGKHTVGPQKRPARILKPLPLLLSACASCSHSAGVHGWRATSYHSTCNRSELGTMRSPGCCCCCCCCCCCDCGPGPLPTGGLWAPHL